MSRPRFLADNDLNDAIVVGTRRREPAAEFARLRDLGVAAWSDSEVLDFAAGEKWIVVSHDVNTMRPRLQPTGVGSSDATSTVLAQCSASSALHIVTSPLPAVGIEPTRGLLPRGF